MRTFAFVTSLTLTMLGLVTCVSGEQAPPTGQKPSVPAPPEQTAGFDSSRAWEHLRQMVSLGPRPAGSAALKETRAYIARQLAAFGLTVQEQPFSARTPNGTIEMVNLIVRLPGKRPDKIVFTGHYDTKLFKEFAFVGANDAGSSAAFLVELARALKDRPREFTYELVWFDGEEAVCRGWDDCGESRLNTWTPAKPGNPDNTYGSRHYVLEAMKTNIRSLRAMILVDMIGERGAVFQREANSTQWLKDIVWSTARELGHGKTFVDSEYPIEDDHLPFLRAGVAAVDIIDLDYAPHWHTETDTLDKLAARSLQIVGDVVIASLPKIEKRLLLEK